MSRRWRTLAIALVGLVAAAAAGIYWSFIRAEPTFSTAQVERAFHGRGLMLVPAKEASAIAAGGQYGAVDGVLEFPTRHVVHQDSPTQTSECDPTDDQQFGTVNVFVMRDARGAQRMFDGLSAQKIAADLRWQGNVLAVSAPEWTQGDCLSHPSIQDPLPLVTGALSDLG